MTRLSRAAVRARDGVDLPAPPVRIVHMGLGAFHRAHQAWYTGAADTRNEWGIAAFTGRSSRGASDLQEQDGLFTLTLRGPDEDQSVMVSSIVSAFSGADSDAFTAAVARSSTAIVTMTITEAGYRLLPDGAPDLDDPTMAADVEALREAGSTGRRPRVESALARLVVGLDARRRAGHGGIAVVPCDNLPGNGQMVRRGATHLAGVLSGGLAHWVSTSVSFVSTSVDRIAPRMSESDLDRVARASGWDDRAAVIAEPFSNWVLCGDFPAGRPQWEDVGALFVDDIEPYERRKLWLLNGAHTLLAALGQLRGHDTVAEASTDPVCVEAVQALWGEAARHLPSHGLDLDAYCADLLSRFRNARIEHRLAQIGEGSELKLRVRIAPVARLERGAGHSGDAAALAIAAWLVLQDAVTPREEPGIADTGPGKARRALASIDDELARDGQFVARVEAHATRLRSGPIAPDTPSAAIEGDRP